MDQSTIDLTSEAELIVHMPQMSVKHSRDSHARDLIQRLQSRNPPLVGSQDVCASLHSAVKWTGSYFREIVSTYLHGSKTTHLLDYVSL